MNEDMNKILIIEDDKVLLDTLAEFLIAEGFEVIRSLDGEKGIHMAIRELPDLILCDIYMPGKDGYQVFEALKNEVTTSLIPFIFMTAKAEREDILLGMKMGADDYITKPFELSELLSRITNRMEKTRKTIRLSEMKYHAIFETAHDAILLVRLNDLKLIDVNLAACDLLGYNRTQLLETSGRPFLTSMDDRMTREEMLLNSWHLQSFRNIETSWKTADGQTITVEVSGKRLNILGEEVLFMMARDVSDVREKEKALYESEERNRNLVENIGEGIGIVDTRERFTFLNPAACQIFGLPYKDMIGKPLPDFLSKEALDLVQRETTFRRSGGRSIYELQITRPDGTNRWLMVTASPQFNMLGEFRGTFGIFRDITERKSYESQHIQAKEKAEESDRLKSTILSNISHELRTPLNGILGFSELLQEELKETEYLMMVENIHISGKRLMATLNAIITLSQLQAGKVTIVLKETNLIPAIHSVCKLFSTQLEEKQLTLDIQLESKVLVFTDQQLLKQLLHQLIDNSVKFTQTGGITISGTQVERNGRSWQTLSVSDTGIGIEPEDLEKIFVEFRQVSEGYDRKYQGTGLGLTICRKIAELLSGEITVESTPGSGTTFTLWLPQTPVEQVPEPVIREITIPEEPKHVEDDQYKPSLLLVEDNQVNKNLIELFVKPCYLLDHAFDGQTAVKMASEKRYDAILMDINLGSGIDGIQATRQIKDLPGYERTPVIAVTGYTMIGDREKLLTEGCTHYIAKPFEKSMFLEVIRQAIQES